MLRPFRLTYPLAFLASACIVGGAPPSLPPTTGAPAGDPQGAPVASGSASTAPVAAQAPAPSAVPQPAPNSAPSVASAAVPVVPNEPASPPYAWKGGDFQRSLTELGRWVKSNGGELSAEISDVASGALLGSIAENTPENPASNQKILTTAAVLHQFGANFRFKTTLQGRREGDTVRSLVIRGSGDPSLSTEDLVALARALSASGVLHVGDVLVDQSFFDDHFVPPAFEQQPNEWAAFRAPVSAVSLDRNVTTLHVTPTELGQPAKAWFEPAGFVDLSGSVRTEKLSRSQNVKLTLKPEGARLSALVAGGIQPQTPEFRYSRRVEDPTLLAGYGLRAALETAGIQVTGKVAAGGAAEQAELASHESKSLGELLPELGKDSDNFYAETLLKDLGAAAKGTPGTSENGASVVLDYLRDIGALDPGTRILNGSGLFDANRVSAHTLVKTLLTVIRDSNNGGVFVDQLAVGGIDGTLQHRFAAFKKSRAVRAKTGTLNRVIALSGYVFRPDGTSPVAFSMIVSGIAGKHAEVRKRVDDLVARVARTLARDES